MRVLGPSDFIDMPWKNGGGRTLQLAVHPEGATIETFDWRVSIATVETSGPFSLFPGCERTLMLLDGGGFELDIAGRRVALDRPLEPVTFSGDIPVSCRLLGGPSRDFGVITRRGRARANVSILRTNGEVGGTGLALVCCVKGVFTATGVTLRAGELLRVTAPTQLAAARDAVAIVVAIASA